MMYRNFATLFVCLFAVSLSAAEINSHTVARDIQEALQSLDKVKSDNIAAKADHGATLIVGSTYLIYEKGIELMDDVVNNFDQLVKEGKLLEAIKLDTANHILKQLKDGDHGKLTKLGELVSRQQALSVCKKITYRIFLLLTV